MTSLLDREPKKLDYILAVSPIPFFGEVSLYRVIDELNLNGTIDDIPARLGTTLGRTFVYLVYSSISNYAVFNKEINEFLSNIL
ncbi:hypothetical protein J4414_04130 [Candidatus Woesearchaeota archaeon]|nr:hypothetical protein [Candidatus Woesearchaeota archaeon]